MKKSDYRIVLKENGHGKKTYYVQQRFRLFWFIPIWLYCKVNINYEDSREIKFKHLDSAERWVEEEIKDLKIELESKQIKKTIIKL